MSDTTELELASRRSDGSLRSYVTMWVVGVGDDLYVRSAYGPDSHGRAHVDYLVWIRGPSTVVLISNRLEGTHASRDH